ncbi:MAG: guanylate kinase [Dysgonamonadaceae bacterium]|nr:guanylate kinase [Dysgonamonadaceae bacterium]MDD4727573.1 guanylate kinase [Dysgonamonadaceae bacterium]
MGKLIIISAPSGTGKSTIVRYLLEKDLKLQFSISATSRLPRGEEKHGVEYYFLTPSEFRERIKKEDFLEYEEVYEDNFYGTLKSEVDRILANGKNVVFDVDCVGGLAIKKIYSNRALAIFIMPPSVEELRNRLEKRGTDTPEVIQNRLDKATHEMTFASQFDVVVMNDDFDKAKRKTVKLIREFTAKD